MKDMKDYEFISYTQYPEDQYVNASCKVRVMGRFVVTYLEKKNTKSGGTFWDTLSAGMTVSGEKKYAKAFKDPLIEDEELVDFIRANVKRLTSVAPSASIQYPHGMGQSPNAPSSMKEVAADEQLPF